MKRRAWSISRRLTIWFAITTAGLVLAISALSVWFVQGPVNSELESLVDEELDELTVLLSTQPATRASITEITQDLATGHPGHPLAWRLWEVPSLVTWGEFGETELLEELTLEPRITDGIVAPTASLRWCVERFDLDPGLEHEVGGEALLIGLLVDGRRQMAIVRSSGLQALGLLLVAAALATVGGALFGRRVSGMLREVAQRVRAVRDPNEATLVEVADAPEEIREVADALSEMLRNIREEAGRAQLMTAGLAHELRSPIQNLLGEAEVALMRERDAAEYRAVLESQVEELRDLGRVVDNLVTLCASTQRSSDSDLEVFDLGREAGLRLQKQSSAAQRAGVAFSVSTHGDLSLRGDREALLLVLRNLVGNAIHWSPQGTTVRLDLAGEGETVTMTVEDEGPGIPDSERERVFEPFYQGRAQDGRRVGYGLGLALTRSAVAAHEGSIDLERSRAGGALFRVRLPRRLAESRAR